MDGHAAPRSQRRLPRHTQDLHRRSPRRHLNLSTQVYYMYTFDGKTTACNYALVNPTLLPIVLAKCRGPLRLLARGERLDKPALRSWCAFGTKKPPSKNCSVAQLALGLRRGRSLTIICKLVSFSSARAESTFSLNNAAHSARMATEG